MKETKVVFIAVMDYDNLGIGYMASILSGAGIKSKIVDFHKNKHEVLKIIKETDPLVIGFSILFNYHINIFYDLISLLRKEGISCHFTAGGHFASLKPARLFDVIPFIDSIVRFEGEYTLLELLKCIKSGEDWRKTKGIAYKGNGEIILNPLRPLEKDLDRFPFPVRSPLKEYAFKKKFATIIAGRGCIHNCSFCNTREFYLRAAGPIKRIRKPEMVIREMEYLYNKRGCSVFLFQDDDFPVISKLSPDWIRVFCCELERTGLNKKVIWKIACRPDEVEEETFLLMKNNGLFQVFLGIEDGTDSGLKRLNKQMTVEKSVKGINILRKLKIDFDYGFILFQPGTTFTSLLENLCFLQRICADGFTPVTFLKLIPLYDTRVEKELMEAGRLIDSDGVKEYSFPEEPMNSYYDFIMDCFTEWLRYPDGVENVAKWARNYCAVFLNYFYELPEASEFSGKIKRIISESNLFLLDNMVEIADIFKTVMHHKNKEFLDKRRKKIKTKHDQYRDKIILTMAEMLSFTEQQKILINT